MEGGVAPGSIPHDLTGAFCAAHSPQLSCSRRHCPLSTHTLASPGCRCMSLQNLQLTESEHDINLVWLTLVTSVFLRWSSSVQSLHQMSRRGEHDKTIQQRSSPKRAMCPCTLYIWFVHCYKWNQSFLNCTTLQL